MAKRSKFQSPVNAEKEYERALKRVARLTGGIIEPHINGAKLEDEAAMVAQLSAYANSQAFKSWSNRTAAKMLASVSASSYRALASTSQTISRELRRGVANTAVMLKTQQLQAEQVALIKSLPIEAGQRAQQLALSAITGGRRPDEVAEELMRTEQVTASRATLIARTESAKASSVLTQARAVSIGSDSYIWRTTEDGDVRESHAEMEGEVVQWSQPPTLSDGTTTHAGQIYNCRCFAEPIFTAI